MKQNAGNLRAVCVSMLVVAIAGTAGLWVRHRAIVHDAVGIDIATSPLDF